MRIRSITVFADAAVIEARARLAKLSAFAQNARQDYIDAGFEVQTTRLALDGVPALQADPVSYAVTVEALAREYGFEFVSLGPAPVGMLPHVPEMFAATR